mmetsp:Transcript_18277/g.49915  ORF Transcript_18277/g.49915 Transcript_18277/m.49915 type:complete len:271 (+) Transcript_18277:43-855(+)
MNAGHPGGEESVLRQRKPARRSSDDDDSLEDDGDDYNSEPDPAYAQFREAELKLQEVMVEFEKDQQDNHRMLTYLCMIITVLGAFFVILTDQVMIHKYDWFGTAEGKEPLTLARYLTADAFRPVVTFHALVLCPWWHWATLQISRPENSNHSKEQRMRSWMSSGFVVPALANVSLTALLVVGGVWDKYDSTKSDLIWKLLDGVLLLTNAATLTFGQLLLQEVQSTETMLQQVLTQQRRQRDRLHEMNLASSPQQAPSNIAPKPSGGPKMD